MTSLTPKQASSLRKYLRQLRISELLKSELESYLTYQIKEFINKGGSFDESMSIIDLEINSRSVRQLDQILSRQGAIVKNEHLRNSQYSINRVNKVRRFTQPLRSMLSIVAFLNITLTGWLLTSKSLTTSASLIAALLSPLLLLLLPRLLRSISFYKGKFLFQYTVWHENFTFRPFSHRSSLKRRTPIIYL